MKYVALLAFKKILLSYPDLVSLHQDVIMSCIDDADVSIRLQALELSAGMVNKDNLPELVDQLLQQLRRGPYTNGRDDDARDTATDIEPVGDIDDDGQEQTLRQPEDFLEGSSALTIEYRMAIIKHVLDMCTKDTYTNISDFEWYIHVLVQLIKFVPVRSGSCLKGKGSRSDRNSIQTMTGDEVLADIGCELRNVAVRVRSVRPDAVQAAASFLREGKGHSSIQSGCGGGGGAIPFAAWVVGEYAEQLDDLDGTLASLTQAKTATQPSTVLCACLQSVPKLLVSLFTRASEQWTAERQTTMSLLMARLLYFLEPLTLNLSLEVQERAVELAELVRLASQAIADHARDSDHWPLLLTKAMPQLFGCSDLNPVAPSAQGRVPRPHDLQLDIPLNPDLANLLHQGGEEETMQSLQAMDFEIFYSQQIDQRTKDAELAIELAIEKSPKVEPSASSYQDTEHSDMDSRLEVQRRLERRLKNKDDPFYIAGEQQFSGSSTPFHDIIRVTNDDDVDVDSIPIMNLDLGDKPSNHDFAESAQTRPRIKYPKAYHIATDENIDSGDPYESQGVSMTASGPVSKGGKRRRDIFKKSLLEVDSSGLGALALEARGSSATSQIEHGEYKDDDADMAKALQEVERLRLEMQRASERVNLSDGISPEGTLVKKKKKKKLKPSTVTPRSGTVVGLTQANPSNKVEADAVVLKRKKRKPPEISHS